MAYWWVNQGSSFKSEYGGGFIWAPIQNAKGKSFFQWEILQDVKAGDVIFSNVNGTIKTVGVAMNDAYPAEKPAGHAPKWSKDGTRSDIKYFKAKNPLKKDDIYPLTSGLWPAKYSPLKENGTGANQGYLFAVPDKAGDILLQILDIPGVTNENSEIIKLNETTKEALVKARIGQGIFRKYLLKRWDNKCAITKSSIVGLLTAAHIKPWAVSDNNERLDPDNGLLLSPNYNALFDRFLISFSEEGDLIKSKRISDIDLALLNINLQTKLRGLTSGNKKYLAFHLQEMLSKK